MVPKPSRVSYSMSRQCSSLGSGFPADLRLQLPRQSQSQSEAQSPAAARSWWQATRCTPLSLPLRRSCAHCVAAAADHTCRRVRLKSRRDKMSNCQEENEESSVRSWWQDILRSLCLTATHCPVYTAQLNPTCVERGQVNGRVVIFVQLSKGGRPAQQQLYGRMDLVGEKGRCTRVSTGS